MGKRQLGELQPFEFVIALIIADLATIPMAEINVPLFHGVIPLITLTIIHFFISFIARKSIFMRKIINGKPVLVITPEGIDYEALKSLNMNLNDLNEALRGLNYFSLDQIEYAIVETNGKISALPNKDNAPITALDLKLEKSESTLPLTIISDGKIMKSNISLAKITEEWVKAVLLAHNFKSVSNIIVATVDNDGKWYVQEKKKKYQTFVTKEFKGGGNW